MAFKDAGRAYCTEVVGKKNAFQCNFCNTVIGGGGITRLKYHLTGTDPRNNVRKCANVPTEVVEELRKSMKDKEIKKKQRNRIEAQVKTELNAHARRKGLVIDIGSENDADDEEDREPEQIRRSMKRALRESRSEDDAVKKLGEMIAKFFIYENIPAYKVKSRHFRNMIATAQELGPGVPLPSPYEIYNEYLEEEYFEIMTEIDQVRARWSNCGCTIMCDGWTGPTRLTIINFLVYSAGHTVFLKSVDASDKINDYKYILNLLKGVIDEVGKENVVHIVTDNRPVYKKVGQELMRKYNLYWSPCATHCLDLMLEDVSKREFVSRTLFEARRITTFIYNHYILLAKVRDACGGDLVRTCVTRFSSNCVAIKSLREKRQCIRKVFTSDWYVSNNISTSRVAQEVKRLVLDSSFWERVNTVHSIYEPMHSALRVVETEVYPTICLIYYMFENMVQQLKQIRGTQWVVEIVQSRWNQLMLHPLHEAACWLNPRYQYSGAEFLRPELISSVPKVFEKLDPNSVGLNNFGNEMMFFRDARGPFGTPTAKASRDKMRPAEWWEMFGNDTPTLRDLAIKILSQTVSAPSCERNWNTCALIHTKQRNHLAYERLEKLLFCSYNMRLQLRDREAELDSSNIEDLLILVEKSMNRMGLDNDDVMVDWIRPVHLDDDMGNPDLHVALVAKEESIDVDHYMRDNARIDIEGTTIVPISSHVGGDSAIEDDTSLYRDTTIVASSSHDGGHYMV